MNQRCFGFRSRHLIAVVLAFAVCAGSAFAQVGNATVVGRVQDPGGAMVVGAQIELRRISTNETFRVVTTGSGDYSIVNLPLDVYEVKASNPGFKTEILSGIKLQVGSTARLDFRLQVGALTESVEVVAQTPILKTENAEFGQVIDHSKIVGLPLNSRDVLGTLGSMTPGLAPTRGNPSGSGDNFNVRGQRASDNVVILDGAFVSQGNAAITFFENPEAVQEFEAKTGLYGAEYGVKPGGQFIMITKSGTNTPHGTLFEQLRNNALDGRNFFDRGSRPPFKRNQFGGVFGAPIYIPKVFNGKDRAFFFFSYSGERIRQFTSATGVVPTVAQKNGQFSTTITDPLTKLPFPGNLIPANRIDPVAKKLLTFWPDPNTPAQGFNFTSPNSSAASNNDQVVAKVDFKISDNDRWSARFLKDNSPITRTNAIQAFFRVDPISSFSQSVNNTRTFKARVVNEFSVSWFRRPYYAGLQSSSPGFGRTLGIANFPASSTDINGVPATSVTGILGIGDGSNSGPSITGNWEVRDNVSFNHGAHSFKAGYNWRRHIEHYAFVSRSSFSFQPRYTGNAIADFLLGDATTATPGSEGLRGRIYQNGQFFYFQDSWKASSRLTIDLGLRYEYRGPWIDQRGFNSNFLPLSNSFSPPVQNLQLQPWETGRFVSNQPFISFNKKGWEPRVGLAYRVASKTVIRTGYGVYGNEPSLGMVQDLGRNPRPNVAVKTYLSNATVPDLLLSNPFPTTINPGVGAPSLTGFDGPMPQNLIHSWGFSVQQQLSSHTVIEAGYQGSHTVHEPIVTDQNDATPGTGDRQARRPFPQYQTIHIIHGSGSASYNGLELKFEQRPGPSGLSLLVAYTWSKSFDTLGGRLGSSGDPTGISRNLSLSVNRGAGEQNPNRLVTNLGYQLPFGPGKRLLPKGVGAAIAGGWSVNSLLSLNKGYYVTPSITTDRLDVGSTTSSRPDLIRNPDLPVDQRTPQRWFDTGAFVTPQPFKYGNAGRSTILGPGYMNLDLSVLRSFRITERSQLEFRFEMFNSLNHTNFGLPGLNFGTSTFGVIGSAYESRDLQLGLKLYF